MVKNITTLRGLLDWLAAENSLLNVDKEIDPNLEVAGVAKALDDGPTLVFNNIKGYPGQRIVSGLFARGDVTARMFGAETFRKLKFKGLEAIKKPIGPKMVEKAPCQEVVIDKELNVYNVMPVLKHSATDPVRVIGGGVVLISGVDIGKCISFKRIGFRGPDWGTMAFIPGSHFEHFVLERRKEKKNLPLTVNIGCNPAVMAVAAGGNVPSVIPYGGDEVAIAGGLQGSPVELVKAKTQDALAVADSEWVIEGYIDTSKTVWESDEAEAKKDFSTPYFPESNGHIGRARMTYMFKVTGITHRKDNPIYYAPMARSYEYLNLPPLTNDAALMELLGRQYPGIVTDVNALPAMMGPNGMVVQVRKVRGRDEDHIRDMFLTVFSAMPYLKMVVMVDDDVDIYNSDDVMWAMVARCNPGEAITILPPSASWSVAKKGQGNSGLYRIGYDCTVPLERRDWYPRGVLPKVDLSKWFTQEQIAAVRAKQSEYARFCAERRV
jgi:4-hydroxy-3-polyprenylbenzoate decarboxylase